MNAGHVACKCCPDGMIPSNAASCIARVSCYETHVMGSSDGRVGQQLWVGEPTLPVTVSSRASGAVSCARFLVSDHPMSRAPS
jgi:hypothetical protein